EKSLRWDERRSLQYHRPTRHSSCICLAPRAKRAAGTPSQRGEQMKQHSSERSSWPPHFRSWRLVELCVAACAPIAPGDAGAQSHLRLRGMAKGGEVARPWSRADEVRGASAVACPPF